LLRELLIMDIRYAIVLMKIKEHDIANILKKKRKKKKKAYNPYRSEISYEIGRIYSRPKLPADKASI
jgi:hypothetical protein